MKLSHILFSIYVFLIHIACQSNQEVVSPPQYDFKKPTTFKMPQVLDEISGITFATDRYDMLYTVQDESGLLYKYELENGEAKPFKFAKRGDYEDIAITDNQVIVLKSNGALLTFPLSDVDDDKPIKAEELKDVLPKGEYEGMFMDNVQRNLFVLCKNCNGDKEAKKTSGYILTIEANGEIRQSGQFSINMNDVEKLAKVDKINFQPSALAKSKATDEWYILSSANNAFVVTDAAWAVKAVYPLPPSIFRQPEGIAFDNENNLYISNEKATGINGNILKFLYIKILKYFH